MRKRSQLEESVKTYTKISPYIIRLLEMSEETNNMVYKLTMNKLQLMC